MSRTWKDDPYRVRVERGDYDDCPFKWYKSAPRWFVQERFNRPERHAAKQQLKNGVEPYPHQPRSRASWYWW